MDAFEARSKLEQDTLIHLAAGGESAQTVAEAGARRQYSFLGNGLKRQCLESLLGVSSHRIERIGQIDMRFGTRPLAPSKLQASIDAFCIVLYNSVAEPLPTQLPCFNQQGQCSGILPSAAQPHPSAPALPRFVRQGPARRVPKTAETDDHWEGGVEHATSDVESQDEELALFLTANTSFLAAMSSTGAFTATSTC